MVSSIEKRLQNVRVALESIEGKPLRFTELMARLTTVTGSASRSENIISLSYKLGYMDKPKRGVYRITGQGINMLNGLRNSQTKGDVKT